MLPTKFCSGDSELTSAQIEQDRLDAVHEGVKLFSGNLRPRLFLKIRVFNASSTSETATEIWASDFAHDNQHAEVTGMGSGYSQWFLQALCTLTVSTRW